MAELQIQDILGETMSILKYGGENIGHHICQQGVGGGGMNPVWPIFLVAVAYILST